MLRKRPAKAKPLREHEFAQAYRYSLRVSCSQDRKSAQCVSDRDQKNYELFIYKQTISMTRVLNVWKLPDLPDFATVC